MAKTIFRDGQSLRNTKDKMRGKISYRQGKDNRVAAAKWPKKRKKTKKLIEK